MCNCTIKPLEWTPSALSSIKHLWVKSHLLIIAYAETIFGTYGLCKGDSGLFYARYDYESVAGPFSDPEAAKAAAQQDFERRILSALEVGDAR